MRRSSRHTVDPDSDQAHAYKKGMQGYDEALQFAETADFLYRELYGRQRDPELTGDDVIDYANFLHAYDDPDHPRVKAFVRSHENDDRFLKRVSVLSNVFGRPLRIAKDT